MPRFAIHNATVFYALAAALVGYILYMMIRRRRGERPGSKDTEPEL